MKNIYDVEPGDVYWAASDVGWVVGHSYIVYGPLLHGCTTILYRGQARRHPGPRGLLAGHRAAQGQGAVHRAHRVPGHQEGRPQGRVPQEVRPLRLQVPLPGGERTDPDTYHWAARPPEASRSSTTGGRPRPAGPSPPTAWASSTSRSSPARPPSRSPATTCGSSTTTARSWRPEPGGHRAWSSCPCRRAPCPPSGRTTTASRSPT